MNKAIFNKKNSRYLFWVSGILISFFYISCGDEPYRLESKDQTIIDSISNKEINFLARNLEDSCKLHFNENVKKLTDSIVEYQIKSIEKQLSPLSK